MTNTSKGPTAPKGPWALLGTLLLALIVAWAQGAFDRKAATSPGGVEPGARGTTTAGGTATAPTPRPAPGTPAAPARDGYAPASAAPRDAIPGGSLRAHENVQGGHTLNRHVGLSSDDLRRRLEAEAKREVSTFADLATADRAVAEVLYRRRTEVASWLARRPDGTEAFRATLSAPVGRVLRRDRAEPVGAKSVVVVIAPSRRFPEGFHIVTAYVSLP